jgi:hypothetical protein
VKKRSCVLVDRSGLEQESILSVLGTITRMLRLDDQVWSVGKKSEGWQARPIKQRDMPHDMAM